DIDRRAALDVVDDDRDGHRLRHRAEVPVEALLRRLVVVRVHDERAVGARALGVTGQVERLRGGVRAGARQDLDALARGLGHDHGVEWHAIAKPKAPALRMASRPPSPRRGSARSFAKNSPDSQIGPTTSAVSTAAPAGASATGTMA